MISSIRKEAGLQIHLVPAVSDNPYQRLLVHALSRQGISAAIEKRPADVLAAINRDDSARHIVHLHWLPQGFVGPRSLVECIRFGASVSKLRKSASTVVWTAHNLYSHESRNRRSERWLTRHVIQRADAIIVHSTRAGAMVREEFGVSPAKRLHVVPHGHYIDCYPSTVSAEEALRKLGLQPNHRVALFMGNIRPYKGVHHLVSAFRLVPSPDARLIIAGRCLGIDTRLNLEAACQADNRIILRLGYVPDDEIQIFMHACDFVALPYLNVLTSGAAILAMSFSRACVAPRSGCLPDFLSAQSELLYEPQSPGGLAATLQRAFEDTALTRDAGARNLLQAKEWNWNRVASETIAVYRGCTASRS